MNMIPLLVAAIAILPLVGVAAWIWLMKQRTEDELQTFVGFDGMHLEDGA